MAGFVAGEERAKRRRQRAAQKKIAGTPRIVGQSHRTSGGKKRKFTTENAETVAMYAPSMLPM